MIKANKKSEETVFNILIDSKNEPHKFYLPYTYQVETENLNIICALLLSFNISVIVKESLSDSTTIIDIIHLPSYEKPMLTYDIGNELIKYSTLDSKEISTSIENITKMIIFKKS